MSAIARLGTAALVVSIGLGPAFGRAQSSRDSVVLDSPAALDVPYLPQSTLLCGGAALAMVERWWGRRGVYAEDFAALVQPALGGIRSTDLTAAARARGWETQASRSSPAVVQQNLREGVPPVVLLQVAPNRYHYVVVLAWSAGRVVFHDPAGAPFTQMEEPRFLARWNGADRWTLLVRPPQALAATPSAGLGDQVSLDSMPCPPWLDQALDAVAAKQLEEAARLLAEARRVCPAEPLVSRELAGVRFKQGRHAEVIPLALEYLALVPGDGLGWQILATSRYLVGDWDGALTAWNRVGSPKVDLVRIDGIQEIRFREIVGAVSLGPGAVLTPFRLALARRRVSEIPALRRSAVEFRPVPGGLVEIRAAVVERPLVDRPLRLVAAGTIRAVAQNEVGLDIASPTGAGELWSADWRWQSARPRWAARIDIPVRLGFQGVMGIESTWEQFRFALDTSGTTLLEETRRSAGLGFGAWVTPALHPSALLRLERWSGDRPYLTFAIGGELHARRDRFVLTATSEHAIALSNQRSYTRGRARAMWASALGLGRAGWSSRLGFDWVGPHAPLGSWPVTGGNLSWAIPLRADPLPRNGYLPGASAGRRIIHAGLSGDHPVHRVGPLVFAAGIFLDGAEVLAPGAGSQSGRFYLDGGAGIRIGVAEGQLGVLRLDWAKSLTADRRSALTVGVHQNWPPFEAWTR